MRSTGISENLIPLIGDNTSFYKYDFRKLLEKSVLIKTSKQERQTLIYNFKLTLHKKREQVNDKRKTY